MGYFINRVLFPIVIPKLFKHSSPEGLHPKLTELMLLISSSWFSYYKCAMKIPTHHCNPQAFLYIYQNCSPQGSLVAMR